MQSRLSWPKHRKLLCIQVLTSGKNILITNINNIQYDLVSNDLETSMNTRRPLKIESNAIATGNGKYGNGVDYITDTSLKKQLRNKCAFYKVFVIA